MSHDPIAPAPAVIHAPHLTEKKLNLKINRQNQDAAKEAVAAKKKPAEKKAGAGEEAGGSRSEGFGQGAGQHGQSPNVVHNHYNNNYYNPGNVINGNVAEGAHVEGHGGAYVQGSVSGGYVAGHDINIGKKAGSAGGAAAGGAEEAVAEPVKTTRTRKPRQPTSKATPASASASAPGATPQAATSAGALGAGPQGRRSQAAAAAEAARQGDPRTFTPQPHGGRPAAELGGSQSRPGGGAPARTPRTAPLALGPAPKKAPEAPTSQPAQSSLTPEQVQQAQGVVVKGEVVKDESSVTPPKTKTPSKAKSPKVVDILDAPEPKISKEELARARSDEPHELDDGPAEPAKRVGHTANALSDIGVAAQAIVDGAPKAARRARAVKGAGGEVAAGVGVASLQKDVRKAVTGNRKERKKVPVTPPGTPPAEKPKTKRFAATRPITNVSLGEGGDQAGNTGTTSEQMARMERRKEIGPSVSHNAVAAAAIAFGGTKATPTTAAPLSPFFGEKHRSADDAVPMPKASAPRPSLISVANVGVQMAGHASGHVLNPHQGQSVSPKGTQLTLHPDTDATKVEAGHHVEVNGTKYKVGSPVKGGDLKRWHVAKDQS